MIREAVILAGGMGTRLRSVVPDLPKPLAPIGFKPFLHYVLSHLKSQQIERVVFSLYYKPELIQQAFGEEYLGLEMDYAIEPEPFGTGGAIRWCAERMHSDRWVVLNGDTYFGVSLSQLEKVHESQQAVATLALKPVPDAGRYGTVVVKNDRVLGFIEKQGGGPALINGGVTLVERAFVKGFSTVTPLSFERDVVPDAIVNQRIAGYIEDGYFIDIGVPQDYQRAQRELPGIVSN